MANTHNNLLNEIKPEWRNSIIKGHFITFDVEDWEDNKRMFKRDRMIINGKFVVGERKKSILCNIFLAILSPISFSFNLSSDDPKIKENDVYDNVNEELEKCDLVFVPTEKEFEIAVKCFPDKYIIIFSNYCKQELKNLSSCDKCRIMRDCVEKSRDLIINNEEKKDNQNDETTDSNSENLTNSSNEFFLSKIMFDSKRMESLTKSVARFKVSDNEDDQNDETTDKDDCRKKLAIIQRVQHSMNRVKDDNNDLPCNCLPYF